MTELGGGDSEGEAPGSQRPHRFLDQGRGSGQGFRVLSGRFAQGSCFHANCVLWGCFTKEERGTRRGDGPVQGPISDRARA